jgi:cytochrome c-type biogenesis protein
MTQIQKIRQEGKEKIKPYPSRNTKKFLFYLGLGLVALIVVITLGPVISHPIERLISLVENRYQQWFDQQNTANPLILVTAPKNPDKSRHVERAVLSTIRAEESRLGKEVR